jgi:hypothetical protein
MSDDKKIIEDNKILNDLLVNLQQGSSITEVIKVIKDEMERVLKIPAISADYIMMMCSVATIILLYKQKYLNELSYNPSWFLQKIIGDLTNNEGIKNLLDENFKKIDPVTWQALAKRVNSEVKFLYWAEFDSQNSNSSLKELLKDKENKLNELPERENFKSLRKEGSYHHYITIINNELQNRYEQPDLLLIDSIMLAEYKAKGIFYPIGNFLGDSKRIENLQAIKEIKIGKTLNGTIQAIPFSRNFHMPAYDEEFIVDEIKVKMKSNNLTLTDYGNSKSKTTIGLIELNAPWEKDDWENSVKENKLFGQQAINKNEPIPFTDFITIGEFPIIPLQAARGAHIVYSLFAYTSNSNKNQASLLSVEIKNDEPIIKLIDKNDLKGSLKSFLQMVYRYVPWISLCLDQIRSATFRNNKNAKQLWFDPCLPIESIKFQEQGILFMKNPIKNDYTKLPLTCLGGYCIALTHSSSAPYEATNIAYELLENYYNNSKVNIPSDNNCRIRLTEDEDEKYMKTPINYAIRPHFDGWKIIEEQISECSRLYISAILLFRSILLYDRKNNNEPLQDFQKIKDVLNDNDKIRTLLEKIMENIILFFDNAVEEADLKQDESYKINKEWVESNFQCIISDRLTVKAILECAIDKVINANEIKKILDENAPTNYEDKDKHKQVNNIIENRFNYVIEDIANMMSENMLAKIQGISSANGWRTRI